MGPLEFIYYLGYSVKKFLALKNQKRLPHRVISVGNLTLGGTGKTPAVIALAKEAQRRGLKPCILTRGYKGKAKGPCFVSKGEGPLLKSDEAGDEAILMAERLSGVPIVKGRDRYETGLFALQHLQLRNADCGLRNSDEESEIRPASRGSAGAEKPKSEILFILDDGFQHWKLYRDMDILLIDGSNPFGNRRLFPSGILREPLREMKRADVIAITKVGKETAGHGSIEALMSEIKRYNRDAPAYTGGHAPVCFRTRSGEELPLESVLGKKVFFFCGIAEPLSFKESLLGVGSDIRGFSTYRDHHEYSSNDVRRILEAAGRCGADWIVTTEKDIIKLSDFGPAENLFALRIEFSIDKGFYDEAFRED